MTGFPPQFAKRRYVGNESQGLARDRRLAGVGGKGEEDDMREEKGLKDKGKRGSEGGEEREGSHR